MVMGIPSPKPLIISKSVPWRKTVSVTGVGAAVQTLGPGPLSLTIFQGYVNYKALEVIWAHLGCGVKLSPEQEPQGTPEERR